MASEKTIIFTRNYEGSFPISKRSPKSDEEKLEVVLLYLEQGKSMSYLLRRYEVSDTALNDWIRKYKQDGIGGLKTSQTWKKIYPRIEGTKPLPNLFYFTVYLTRIISKIPRLKVLKELL